MRKLLFYFFTILRNQKVQLIIGGGLTMLSLVAGGIVARNGLLTWYFFQPQKEVAGASIVISPSPHPVVSVVSPVPSVTPQPSARIPLQKIAILPVSPSPVPSPTEQPRASSEPNSNSGQGTSNENSGNSSQPTPEPSVDPSPSSSQTPIPSATPTATATPSFTPQPSPSDNPSGTPIITQVIQSVTP